MLPELETIEVALFPIPDVVAFPGMVLPLHVFEPRYRQLVQDCVADRRLLAVSHTLKVIHQPSLARSPEEALSSNQATYKPHSVFSAGHCEIVETLPDGRILAKVTMSQRLTLIDEVQSLPYRIVSCTRVEDDEASSSNEANRSLQRSIHKRLIELAGAESANLSQALEATAWSELEPGEYSFKIFQVLRFEPDLMQSILETRSVAERLAITAGFLGTS